MESTILVIEDDKECSEFVSTLLRLEGYNVRMAFTGRSGVELTYQLKPDLILCDDVLTEVDGYGVLHILSRDPDTAKIPFIFLSAKVSKGDFRKGMNLGADDYILKPFDSTDLLSAIEVRLKKYAFMRNNFDLSGDYRGGCEKEEHPKELCTLFEKGLRRVYGKKEFLFRIGESQHYLYFIAKGEVKLSNTNEDGKEIIFELIGNHQSVGYKSLFMGAIHTEDAVALSPTEARLINANEFQQLVYTNRELAQWFINRLSVDLIQTEVRLLNLAYRSVRQKVAAALIQVCEHQKKVFKGDALVSLSRKNLAAIVGTALESFNRTILEFRKEGVLEITSLGIHIVKMQTLEQIALH